VLGTLLVPFGLGSGVAFWYAGRRAGGVRAWERAGALWFGLSLTGYLVALTTKEDHFPVPHALGLVAMFAGWGGAFVHALVIRPEYVRRVAPRVASAQERADVAEARRIVREEPRLAVELGIGRPDRDGAYDAGLVDVNHAPARALEELPGVGAVLARRIEGAREACDGFASVDELAALLDLDGATVERMRDRAVFLPR
jgi:DNA uptake protein ComE-like DNA-binding protein